MRQRVALVCGVVAFAGLVAGVALRSSTGADARPGAAVGQLLIAPSHGPIGTTIEVVGAGCPGEGVDGAAYSAEVYFEIGYPRDPVLRDQLVSPGDTNTRTDVAPAGTFAVSIVVPTSAPVGPAGVYAYCYQKLPTDSLPQPTGTFFAAAAFTIDSVPTVSTLPVAR